MRLIWRTKRIDSAMSMINGTGGAGTRDLQRYKGPRNDAEDTRWRSTDLERVGDSRAGGCDAGDAARDRGAADIAADNAAGGGSAYGRPAFARGDSACN